MALLNVLINARDAMPDGGQVRVSTPMLAGQVAVCILDEGEGMAPDVVQRATEPFFTTKGPGTGLGLAMVHGLVQQSRGRLEIDSAPGKGTTVRLVFPADGAPEAQPDVVAEDDGAKTRILVVEDDADVRELAETMLQLADQVRARRPGTPILVTTGYMDELPAARGQRLDILSKPYRQEDLLTRVRAILPGSNG